ncbi:MAG: HEAT repeat domain-containing protein [Planctomycetota bacterium]
MKLHRPVVLVTLLLVALGVTPVFGQATAPTGEEAPQDVSSALQALKDAPTHERAEARSALVEAASQAVQQQGAEALQPIIQALEQRAGSEDRNYLSHCVLALGQIGSVEATDLLLDVLAGPETELSYQAAVALGNLWQGKGSQSGCRAVNAALLARLYSGLPPSLAYAPAKALLKINNIGVSNVGMLGVQELRNRIDEWVEANQDRLPPPEDMPWQVLTRLLLTAENSSARAEPKQTLLNKRSLGPVNPILDALTQGDLSAEKQQDLADLLGQLTGATFPPGGGNSSAAQEVEQWRRQWTEVLKDHSEERFVHYAWNALETSLVGYNTRPNEQAARRVRQFRNVLLHQLPDADAIPADASEEARRLVEEPLEIKKQMADAVATMENPPDQFEKGEALTTVEEMVDREGGPEIGEQFVNQLVSVAYDETNLSFAERLGYVLWDITKVPMELDAATLQERRAQLESWIALVRRTRPEINLQAP